MKKITQFDIKKLKMEISQVISKVHNQWRASNAVIGLDIGTTSIKLAQIANVDGELTLMKTSFVDIETFSSVEKMPEEKALAALKKVLSDINARNAQIVCVVNCPKTCVRKIVVPKMPTGELAEAVRWEAKNFIPFSLDDAIFDFHVLGETMDKGVKKLSVAVAVSPRETVDRLLSLFTKLEPKLLQGFGRLGPRVSSIIPMSFALQNFIKRADVKPDETIALVELGASSTELNVFSTKDESNVEGKNAILKFSRRIPSGGMEFTRSLTAALVSGKGKVELSMKEAEDIKRKIGMPAVDDNRLIEEKISASQILSLIRPVVEKLLNELDRSFDFYREKTCGDKVDRIILFGGGACLKGLAEFLGEELGVEVSVGNPLENLKVTSDAALDGKPLNLFGSHRFDLAIGAALNEVKSFDFSLDTGINLLPKELKEEPRRFVERVSLKAVAAAVMMSFVLVFMGLQIQSAAYQRKLKALKLEYTTLIPQLKEAHKKMLINQLLWNKPPWENVLKEISNTLPTNIYLNHLSMDDDIVKLKGVLTQGGQTSESTLSDYMLILENGIFKNVSLITIQKVSDSSGLSEFEIEGEID